VCAFIIPLPLLPFENDPGQPASAVVAIDAFPHAWGPKLNLAIGNQKPGENGERHKNRPQGRPGDQPSSNEPAVPLKANCREPVTKLLYAVIPKDQAKKTDS
jgi:hypothetical protein